MYQPNQALIHQPVIYTNIQNAYIDSGSFRNGMMPHNNSYGPNSPKQQLQQQQMGGNNYNGNMAHPFQPSHNPPRQKSGVRPGQSARSYSKGKAGAQGLNNTGQTPIVFLGTNMKGGKRGESQNHPKSKINQGFFYSPQIPQQQIQPIPLQNVITQVQQNQPMPELSQELKNQIQGFQKFSKEGCPEDKGALGPQKPHNKGKKTLVLDLDETLVHSSFKTSMQPDIVLPVDIEGTLCNVFVLVRPGTELFLQRLSKIYEVVIYTASLSKYADPLIDILDSHDKKVIDGRLFREHCTFVQSVFIKDMSLIGRDLAKSIIIDNSPTSYTFHQENALPILSWYDDMKDRCLFELIPLLESLADVDDVRKYIPKFVTIDNRIDFQRASQILANAKPQLAQIDEESSVKQVSQRSSVKRKQIEILENQEEETEKEEINKLNIQEQPEVKQEQLFQKQNSIEEEQKEEEIEKNQGFDKKTIEVESENIKVNNQLQGKEKFKGQSIFKKFKEKQENSMKEQMQRSSEKTLVKDGDDPPNKFVSRPTDSGKKKKRVNPSSHQRIPSEQLTTEMLDKIKVDLGSNTQIKEEEVENRVPQEGRPVTRDPKRQEQYQGNDLQQKHSSPMNVKNLKAQQKSRKISNQYYSRTNQLQHLLNTDGKNVSGVSELTNPHPLYPEFSKNQSKTPKDYSVGAQKQDTVQSSIQKLQQLNVHPTQITPKSNQVHTSRFFGQTNGSIHLINTDVTAFSTSRDQSQRSLKQNTGGYLGRIQNRHEGSQQHSSQFLTQQRKKKQRFLQETTDYPSTSRENPAQYSLNSTNQIQYKQTPRSNAQNPRGRALQGQTDRRNTSKQSLQLGNNSFSRDSQVQQLTVSNSAKAHTSGQNRPSSAKRPNLLTQSFQNIQPQSTTHQQARQQFGNLVAAFEAQTPYGTNRQHHPIPGNENIQFSPIMVGSQQRNLFKAQNRKTISQRRILQHQND